MFLWNFNQRWRTGSTIIPKLHQWPFKQRYSAGSAKCSTKPLSKLLTCILSAVKTGLQSYCDTIYSRGGVNQMWILKNSKDLLEYIQSRSLFSYNSINTFDFSTPYITIPQTQSYLNSRNTYWPKHTDQKHILTKTHRSVSVSGLCVLVSKCFWSMCFGQ